MSNRDEPFRPGSGPVPAEPDRGREPGPLRDSPEGGETSAAADLYARLRGRMRQSFVERRRRTRPRTREESEPFGLHRDPRTLGNVVGELSQNLGWTPFLAESELLSGWPELVGDDIAANTVPREIRDGILRVTCSSTAWATQLRLLSPEILIRITRAFPEANLTGLQFRGPDQPSWKHGPRTVPGRGPRDTYG